ncbi:MFS transporter [Streptomyces sp. MS19]|uniref:MFS transporter n=1 Tax=Streptomyces sp. MS19 TaxID=3385972 RepID=UPI0039A00DBA
MAAHSAHHAAEADEGHPGQGAPGRWRALALLSVAQFMLILDVTVVTVALPDIGAGLGLDRSALTWVVSGYTLVFGGMMLLGGRTADLWGPRRPVLGGLAVFTAASLVAGLAGGPAGAVLLLGARAAQGLGAAFLSPAALAAVTTAFQGAERRRALGVWAALGGTGSAVGVLAGGLLAAGPGWRWIFFVNVPVGLALLAALPSVLPRSPRRGAHRLDIPGALLVTAATAAAIQGLIRAGDDGWSSGWTLGTLALALLLYGAFAVVQRRSRAPLMDLAVLARRPVVTGVVLMLVGTALLITQFFLGSFYLQRAAGHGPLATGLLFLPVAAGTVVGAHTASRAAGRFGARPVAPVALLVTGAALAVPAASLGTATLAAGMSLAAAGIGAVLVCATTTALTRVPHHEAGLVSGVVNTCHEFGASLGVAVVSSVAAVSIASGGAGASGFRDALWLATAVAAVTAALAPFLIPGGRPPAGTRVSMH